MAEALIDLDQLARNIRTTQARLRATGTKLLFPVKANAYGHGAVPIAQHAQDLGVDYLGVANLPEALQLRQAGITLPILIMSASHPRHIPHLAALDVDVTLSDLDFARALDRQSAAQKRRTRVQVKIDTGMGRNGIWWEQALPLLEGLSRLPHLEVIGIFSHFSVAYSSDPEDLAFTQGQIEAFNSLLARLDRAGLLPPLTHIANSSGLIQFESQVTGGYFNMVRPGILLYGAPEVRRPWTEPIKPILKVRTWITTLKAMPPNRSIGYGRKYRTAEPRRVATLPLGYADGISWHLANRGQVLIHGQRAPLIGGISMDQVTADVTHIPGVRVGDEAYLIHEQLPAAEMAQMLGAHFSEVVFTALSPRIARLYHRNEAPS